MSCYSCLVLLYLHGIALTFYTSVEKGLKLKVTKFWRLILMFVEVTGEKRVGGAEAFCHSHNPLF